MVIRNDEVPCIHAHSTSLNMSLNMQTSYTVEGLKINFPKVCSINPLKYQRQPPSHACCSAGTSWSQNSTSRLHLDFYLKWALLPAVLFFSSLPNI